MILYLVQPLWGQSILAQDALRDTMIRDCRMNWTDLNGPGMNGRSRSRSKVSAKSPGV